MHIFFTGSPHLRDTKASMPHYCIRLPEASPLSEGIMDRQLAPLAGADTTHAGISSTFFAWIRCRGKPPNDFRLGHTSLACGKILFRSRTIL